MMFLTSKINRLSQVIKFDLDLDLSADLERERPKPKPRTFTPKKRLDDDFEGVAGRITSMEMTFWLLESLAS